MAEILIVDDDREIVARNTRALEASGHRVTSVTGVEPALLAVRRRVPDLVVLEAMLDGGLGGFGLARTLARDFPTLPLIMLTRVDEHMAEADLARQDRDGGWLPVERFLQKPVMPEVLAYEVEHLLSAAA